VLPGIKLRQKIPVTSRTEAIPHIDIIQHTRSAGNEGKKWRVRGSMKGNRERKKKDADRGK
jgi:hypothetical protein